MPIEGFVILHPRGHYALYQPDRYYKLNDGDQLEVDTGQNWLPMEVAYSLEGYYLRGNKISFFPKMVYARKIEK